MIDALVLFCGGPPIYGGAPKPLQKLCTGETLIERYLSCVNPLEYSEVVLLVDQAFEDDYIAMLAVINYASEITTLACADNSTTLTKLRTFLKSGYPAERTVMFSYPDMFVIGEIDAPNSTDSRFADSVFISFTPVVSRFPRLVVDAYDNTVRGISNHTSPIPANPVHVFGGHLLVRAGLMNNLVDTFLSEVRLPAPSLEFDMFFWLINAARMHAIPIYGRWIQADSPRAVETILNLT